MMSEPQDDVMENDVTHNEQTLEDAGKAFEAFDEMEEEDRIGGQIGSEEEEESSSSGENEETGDYQKLAAESSRLEDLLRPYGGAEGAARALEMIKNSPEYQAVTNRLLNGRGKEEVKEEEDPNLDEATKKAYQIIDKRVEKILGKSLTKLESELKDNHIKPLSDSFQQTKLETIEGQMISTYGKDFYKSMEKDMDKVLAEMPASHLNNPSFKKIDDVFHTALRRAGKAEKYYSQKNQEKIKGKKEKSTGDPGRSGNTEEKLQLRKVKNIEDALFNAELKAGRGETNRENAKSRIASKSRKG